MFISVVFTLLLPRTPKSFSPTATLDPRPRQWTCDRDILDPRPRLWTRDPRPATISRTRYRRVSCIKKIFSLYIVFISVVFTLLLPRTPNHFPLPRHWTRDRDNGPATATLDPRPRLWTRDPRPATISRTHTAKIRTRELATKPQTVINVLACRLVFSLLGPAARSLVSANRWLRGIKMYRFPWYLTLVSTNHASSNPGLIGFFLATQ